jgi:hypothetical protein
MQPMKIYTHMMTSYYYAHDNNISFLLWFERNKSLFHDIFIDTVCDYLLYLRQLAMYV